MDHVSLFLLVVAGIVGVGLLGEAVFERTGLPDVLWLLLVGILLGPVTGLVERSALLAVAPYFGALTIVLVLFDGGMALRIEELGRSAARAALLAVLGFACAAATVALVCHAAAARGLLPAGFGLRHGVALGVILGGSSSIVVLPALRTARAPERVTGLLGVESALTDVLCIVGTAAAVQVLVTERAQAGDVGAVLARSLGVGAGLGAATGALSIPALRLLRRNEHAFPITFAVLLALYVVVEWLGGSAPLAIFAAAVMVGNAPALSRTAGFARQERVSRSLRNVQGQVTFLVKTFFFVFMGAMLGPPWSLVLLGAALACALFLARLPAVTVATAGMGLAPEERALARVSIPRGLAAGVLAAAPSQAGVHLLDEAPTIVFAAVAGTVLLFAAGFAWARRRHVPDVAPAQPSRAPADAHPTVAHDPGH